MNQFSLTVVSSMVTADSGIGDTTREDTSTVYDGCRFAPRSSAEQYDPQRPGVITGGSIYRRGDFPVTSKDRIVIDGVSPLIDGTWQVEGDAGYWGRGVEVAVKRWS